VYEELSYSLNPIRIRVFPNVAVVGIGIFIGLAVVLVPFPRLVVGFTLTAVILSPASSKSPSWLKSIQTFNWWLEVVFQSFTITDIVAVTVEPTVTLAAGSVV
jgi:hypothetical protein